MLCVFDLGIAICSSSLISLAQWVDTKKLKHVRIEILTLFLEGREIEKTHIFIMMFRTVWQLSRIAVYMKQT